MLTAFRFSYVATAVMAGIAMPNGFFAMGILLLVLTAVSALVDAFYIEAK